MKGVPSLLRKRLAKLKKSVPFLELSIHLYVILHFLLYDHWAPTPSPQALAPKARAENLDLHALPTQSCQKPLAKECTLNYNKNPYVV